MRETCHQAHDTGEHVTVKHYLLTAKCVSHESPEERGAYHTWNQSPIFVNN